MWHQHYPDGAPGGLDYPAKPIDWLLRDTAVRYPDSPALVFGNYRLTYCGLDDLVGRLAAGLQSLGLRPGDRVALFMPNCPQLVMAYYAVWRAGGVTVPVNPAYVAREFERQVNDAGATIAICLDSLWAQVEEGVFHTGLRRIVLTGMEDYAGGGGSDEDGANERGIGMVDLLARSPVRPTPVEIAPEDTAALMYTGGTTGAPKGAQLTHRNLVANAAQIAAWLGGILEGQEVVLTALPLTHSYSMTMCMNQAIYRGYAQVLIPNARDIGSLLAAIDRHRPTLVAGVPSLFMAISRHPDVAAGRYDLSCIKACVSGAAPLPPEVQQEFERVTGGRLVEGYGLTEASPITHCNPLHTGGRIGTIGLPLFDTDCKIVDSETETTTLEAGQAGVLCVSGPQVMQGYWGMPAETAEVLRAAASGLPRTDEAGKVWLHTGDIAVMSEDGYFRIVDRKKDVIIAAGGLKVYPREVEDVLYEHPKVMEAAVIGMPLGGGDQRAMAFVVLRPGQRASAEEIRAFCRQRLARYKVPKTIEFRASLPKSGVGKVLRRLLAPSEETEKT